MAIDHAKVLNFTDALEATRMALGTKGFRAADEALVKELGAMVVADGPSATHAPSLDRLRLRIASGGDDCTTLFEIAGLAGLADGAAIEGDAADKVAALKFLRHVYPGSLRGGQQLWIARRAPRPRTRRARCWCAAGSAIKAPATTTSNASRRS